MSAVSDLVNGWPGGIIQSGRQGLFVTPIYLVNRIYAQRLGADRLTLRVDGTTRNRTLDAVASRAADGRSIFLKTVNTDLERPVTAHISVHGAQVSPNAVVERVTADSLSAVNGFATPDAVRISHESVKAGNSFVLDLPAHSVAVVTLSVAR